MSDSVLKKEFTQKDVRRIRNLIKKDFTSGVSTQVGYTKPSEIHNEGEEWDEHGKTWVIKNGVKRNITKLHAFKKLNHIPLACPRCKCSLNSEKNKKMYRIHQLCLNCVVEFETKLKIAGKYEEYEKQMIGGNIKFFLKEYEEFMDYALSNHNQSYVTEGGDIEKWEGKIDKEKILNDTKTFIDKGHEFLKTIQ